MTPAKTPAPDPSRPPMRWSPSAELTDPGIPAANKGNIVTPGFSPDEAGTIDDHLNRMRAGLPLNFVVTKFNPHPTILLASPCPPRDGLVDQLGSPIVLVNQGGHWMITNDTAVAEMLVFWHTATRYIRVERPRMNWTKLSLATHAGGNADRFARNGTRGLRRPRPRPQPPRPPIRAGARHSDDAASTSAGI